MNLSFDDVQFRYDPYPIGLAKSVLSSQDYTEMVENWPAHELFFFVSQQGNKYSLSEAFHARQYHAFVRSQPVWREFYGLVKSRQFIQQVVTMRCDHNIDLNLRLSAGRGYRGPDLSITRYWKIRARAALTQLGRLLGRATRLSGRFEFAMMPADGGCILPHTDLPEKVISLVYP